jgi:hypothetical protein
MHTDNSNLKTIFTHVMVSKKQTELVIEIVNSKYKWLEDDSRFTREASSNAKTILKIYKLSSSMLHCSLQKPG